MTTAPLNIHCRFIKISLKPSSYLLQLKLITLTPYQNKGKFLYHLKPWLDQKVHALLTLNLLFIFIIITQWLSVVNYNYCFSTGKIMQQPLTFGDWHFVLTRLFRPRSGHLNENIYCKPINRFLNVIMLFIKRLDRFLQPTTPKLWKFF